MQNMGILLIVAIAVVYIVLGMSSTRATSTP
jgi:hypothetical protein